MLSSLNNDIFSKILLIQPVTYIVVTVNQVAREIMKPLAAKVFHGAFFYHTWTYIDVWINSEIRYVGRTRLQHMFP